MIKQYGNYYFDVKDVVVVVKDLTLIRKEGKNCYHILFKHSSIWYNIELSGEDDMKFMKDYLGQNKIIRYREYHPMYPDYTEYPNYK